MERRASKTELREPCRYQSSPSQAGLERLTCFAEDSQMPSFNGTGALGGQSGLVTEVYGNAGSHVDSE